MLDILLYYIYYGPFPLFFLLSLMHKLYRGYSREQSFSYGEYEQALFTWSTQDTNTLPARMQSGYSALVLASQELTHVWSTPAGS